MSTSYDWYGGSDITLEANVSKSVEYVINMGVDNPAADFFVSMGKIDGIETKASAITISNLSLVKVSE
jgi:hypothetical protein